MELILVQTFSKISCQRYIVSQLKHLTIEPYNTKEKLELINIYKFETSVEKWTMSMEDYEFEILELC